MTNYDYVEETIKLFEASLAAGAPITTAGALAERIGYSRHHLGRLFQSLCGEALGRYMHARRLAAAVCAIRSGSHSATEAARRYGWEDYSAFARAVRSSFAASPSALKTLDPGDIRLAVRARPRIPESRAQPLEEPTLITTDALHVTGPVFYMGRNERSFHRPWRIFMRNRLRIQGAIGEDSWQFSSWDDSAPDEDDGLWIHCAVQTDPSTTQDLRFFSRSLPAMRILAFTHRGPIETIHDSYRRIWVDYLPQSPHRLAGNFEFQHYTPDGSVTICLPVEDGGLPGAAGAAPGPGFPLQ